MDASSVTRRSAHANCGETMAPRDTADIVRVVIEEIWNKGALDLADELIAQDYINHGGLIPDVVRGPEAIKLSVALYRLAFPALEIAIDELAVDGEIATLRWTARGMPTDGGVANATAGVPRALVGVTLSRFAGRQIVESWTYWDVEGEVNRLGLISNRSDRHSGVHSHDDTSGFVA
jgi:SnoaL-like polyketide cyclase